MRRTTNHEASGAIAARNEFKNSTGSLTGFIPEGGVSTGVMPPEYAEVGRLAEATYVVKSYATPIAWFVPGEGWVRPPVKYSVTTSRHQGSCPQHSAESIIFGTEN